MAKKNVKPYGSSNNRNRTLSNAKNSVIKKSNKKKDDSENSFENTTRIRIDSKRINDAESLDTSFLEGRLDKKVRDNSKAKEKILKEKKQILFDFEIIKWIFFSLAFLCVIILAIIYLKNSPLLKIDDGYTDIDEEKSVLEKNTDKSNNLVDYNYLFVGDYNINKLDFSDLDYHYVKCSEDDLTTEKLLESLKAMVYDFNPSDVFIQVGINDLNDNVSVDNIISNYKKIVMNIKTNRPYAKINIISLFYINEDIDEYDSSILSEDIDNDKIRKLNNELKSMSIDENIDFLEFDDLFTDNDKLNSKYTDNGIYLNDDGSKIVMNKIKKYLDDEE